MPTSPGPTIAEVGERQVIREIMTTAPSRVNGDDAAVLVSAQPNSRVVVSTDMLVERRHFRLDWSTPQEVGSKAILQNFADIEAMGARPVGALLALSAPPETPVSLVRGLAEGIERQVERFSAELVGGDLTAGENLVLSVTAVGSLGGDRRPLSIDAARPGQILVAAGAIGDSAAGLALLERYGREVPEEFLAFRDAHTNPYLPPGRGMIARATGATAATDNSDGLVADLTTMAERSGVAIDLDPKAIAPSESMIRLGERLGIDPWSWVLAGGEDHTIVATTPGNVPSGFRRIGIVQRGGGVAVGGQPPVYRAGWLSF
ncbi:thiamine-phosphate kinase [Corynebacterium sp. zg-331]|uniref:thiamine-phosphate kinase n=1 Tax=unclassified Corynebacterium TaxID=2624378 RepID=UPI00128E2664|nr:MULTISPECIES: thiamine-phosphate kinase [unclassified Corynebacterium]MBC3186263.1 thiamine-phosphate kinase [Corynebacterium sp. zg-331]MPV52750.1 thiamine-phosphate kinase [Corynebacterium sp. zg331]